jgi:D-methionine transport system substrate-binding protein
MKKITSIVLSLFILVLGFSANAFASEKKAAPIKYTIGLNGNVLKQWDYIKNELAKDNIDLVLVVFDSYPLPNRALADKEVDINAFQHYAYLNNEIKRFGYDIIPIADTVYAPLGLYSQKITSLDQLKDGDKIVIPDDTTNGGRALILLEANGLIEVDDAAGWVPTVKNITKNPHNYQIVELEAVNIPGSLPEVALAAVNSGVAVDAGIIGKHIVLEIASKENPYVNVIAVRREDKDNEIAKKIIAIYHTDEVKKIIIEQSKGSQIPVW